MGKRWKTHYFDWAMFNSYVNLPEGMFYIKKTSDISCRCFAINQPSDKDTWIRPWMTCFKLTRMDITTHGVRLLVQHQPQQLV